MQKTLTTSRLTLRPLALVDANWMKSFWQAPEIHRNTATIPASVDTDFCHERIRQANDGEEAQTHATRLIELNEERVGMINISRANTTDAYTLGYAIHPDFWAQGIATEAADCFLKWADGFVLPRYYVSGHFADNPASGTVLRKIGFLPCWRGPVFSRSRNEKVDHIYMSRIAD